MLLPMAFYIGPLSASRVALLLPSVATFMFFGLAVCGFESLPFHGFFLMNLV